MERVIQRLKRIVLTPLLAASALAGISLVVHYAEQKEMRLMSIVVDAAAGEFSQWLRDSSQMVKTLSELPVFKNGSIEEISKRLNELGVAMPDEVEKLIYINKDGVGYYNTGEIFDLSDRAYFRAAMVDKSADFIVTNPFEARSTGNLIVAFVHAIKDDANATKALVFASANVKKLTDKTRLSALDGDAKSVLIGNAGRLFVYEDETAERKLIARNSPDRGFAGLGDRRDLIISANTSGRVFYKDERDRDRILFFSPVAGSPDWTYGVSLDKDFFDADRNTLLAALIAIALFSFFAALSIKRRN
ncbi:MAG: hypothetical protein LBC09_03970 [Helicobacteraceae bacterium]|jgi:methyl-accepting chemotaxis protein|nr:hypothetical protein [Helicobacteraceae bacterium]